MASDRSRPCVSEMTPMVFIPSKFFFAGGRRNLSGGWVQRFEISDDRFSVRGTHTKLRHRRAQLFPIAPNTCGQEFHHFGVSSWGRLRNARRYQRPVSDWFRRHQPNGAALQPSRPVGGAGSVAWRVALAAHGKAFHNVFSASDHIIVRLRFRLIFRWLCSLRDADVTEGHQQ
jgi:hypothetical protein